ncbi:hypothetical protein [Serratia grimesii]|uniref:hypothetical protein n=1 Tax=Serratia grimesii TaxID=82995 RepID=UPI0021781AAC|nr:hypothetical protein [Serratia grimesii]CAI0765349.1 Uncharacterised protein [Serratia grimesii]
MNIQSPFFASIMLVMSVFSSAQSIPLARAFHPEGSIHHPAVVNCSDTAELPDEKIVPPASSASRMLS